MIRPPNQCRVFSDCESCEKEENNICMLCHGGLVGSIVPLGIALRPLARRQVPLSVSSASWCRSRGVSQSFSWSQANALNNMLSHQQGHQSLGSKRRLKWLACLLACQLVVFLLACVPALLAPMTCPTSTSMFECVHFSQM